MRGGLQTGRVDATDESGHEDGGGGGGLSFLFLGSPAPCSPNPMIDTAGPLFLLLVVLGLPLNRLRMSNWTGARSMSRREGRRGKVSSTLSPQSDSRHLMPSMPTSFRVLDK